MSVFFVTGKLGAGKTLVSVCRIRDYLLEGRRVATNLDLNLEHLVGHWKKSVECYRLPDKPKTADLDALPLGYDGDFIGESRNGLLVFDECGTWFNSRTWNDPDRRKLINWLLQLRKRRWDCIFIVQDIAIMDKQARETMAEHVVYCRRSDRFNIPIFSTIYKLFTDKPLPLPKVHIAFVRYGDQLHSPVVDRWVYRAHDIYSAYDTQQVFREDSNSLYQYLPPDLISGRYITRWSVLKDEIANIKLKSRHFFLAGAAIAAFSVNSYNMVVEETPQKGVFSCNDAYIDVYGSCDKRPVSRQERQVILAALKERQAPTQPVQAVEPETEETYLTTHELDGVHITASVKRNDGYDYIFESEDGPFYPSGYRVRWVNPCSANLIKNGHQYTVNCK